MNMLVLQMFLISAEVSGNITEAVRNHTGKEPERMNRLRKIFKNMKYRHKLTIFLVVTSLVPMTVLAWYSHSRLSTMVRSSELEDMQSIMEQTRESIDSQTAVYASLLNYLTYSPDIEEIIKEKNIEKRSASVRPIFIHGRGCSIYSVNLYGAGGRDGKKEKSCRRSKGKDQPDIDCGNGSRLGNQRIYGGSP